MVHRLYYNAVWGAIGGLIGWFLAGQVGISLPLVLRDALAGASVGIGIGGLLGAMDGLVARSLSRTTRGGLYGVMYGVAGGASGVLLGELVLLLLKGGILGRALGWGLLGLAVGLSESLITRAPRKRSYGAIGGTSGGCVGGAVFEAVRLSFGSYALSQALGLIILGACIGSLISLAEALLRDAWVKVVRGRQEGQEWTLAWGAAIIGRDQHSHIVLFDDQIAPKHAEIRWMGSGLVLSRLADAMLKVNGQPVTEPCSLRDGDRIELGATRLLFRRRRQGQK